MELRTAVSTSDPVTIAIARGDLRAMWQAVSELSPQQQRAFLLREFSGLSYEELAVALGVSTGAIESLLFRARSRLRSRLEAVLASLGTPAWLAAVRDLVPRWLDAGGATKVAAATAATVVAGGTFVGERELVHPRHAAPVASSALRSPRPVERAAVIPTPEAAPTARSPGSGPAVVPSSSSGERGPGGGSEGPGSSDSSGKGSSGEGSGEPEGLTSTGETSGASSGSDKGSSGSDGVDSDSSGSGKGGSGPDHD
jgi:transcriptional regulator with XRE-family HTH domain